LAADGSLTSTQDTPDGSAGRLKAVKDKAIEDKKIDLDKTIEASLTTIDGLAEAEYLQWKPNQKMTQAEADIAFTGFASNVAHEIDNQLLTVQEQAVMGYRFQVLNLEHIIKEGEQQNKSNEQSESGNTENSNKRPDISDIRPTYIDRWETKDITPDRTPNSKSLENVYKKDHMHEAMKELLKKSNNTIDKLSNGTFGVNLSKED
jgi:RNA polymerase-binding transcription factor DksA